MKKKLFGVLKVVGKVAGVAAAGAVVASPDSQAAIVGALPAPYNALAGSAIALVALWMNKPGAPKPPAA